MESVAKENNENEEPESYIMEDGDTDPGKTTSAITATYKLDMECFRFVTKNLCSLPNCEYSHDKDVVAAARDKQISDLTKAKKLMQAAHQANLRVYDKQGAKAVSIHWSS